MAIYGWILEGWGNKDLWILDNASWDSNTLITGSNEAIGSAYRNMDVYNKDWYFKLLSCLGYHPIEEEVAHDVLIYLKNDPKPIIFRYLVEVTSFYYSEGRYRIQIIYDGIIRNQSPWYDGVPVILFCGYSHYNEITREDSNYTFKLRIGTISWDYGLEVQPVKIELRTILAPEHADWSALNWYYTEPITEATEDYAFIM